MIGEGVSVSKLLILQFFAQNGHNRGWCATETDDDGNYVGKWGYCSYGLCPGADPISKASF